MLRRTNFSSSQLQDTDFSRTVCRGATFAGANISRADLTNAYMRSTICDGASFYRAILDGTDFRDVSLKMASLYRASLNNTELEKSALGDSIVQDDEAAYEAYFRRISVKDQYLEYSRASGLIKSRLAHGEMVYQNLKTMFRNNGRYADASWAYLRERQVRRQMHAPYRARHYYGNGYPQKGRFKWVRKAYFFGRHTYYWVLYWLAEVTCGHGEKPMRPIAIALLTLLLFPLVYSLTGGIVVDSGTMTWLDYFNYSFAAFTTLGFEGFRAATPLAQTLTSIEALLGISLLALLMFVLGNSLRTYPKNNLI